MKDLLEFNALYEEHSFGRIIYKSFSAQKSRGIFESDVQYIFLIRSNIALAAEFKDHRRHKQFGTIYERLA